MNGAPGTLLEQGIVGLLKCVKILVILQSRWWLVVRIPSILLFVKPLRLLLFLSVDLLQKFMGREKKAEGGKNKNARKLQHRPSFLQINSFHTSASSRSLPSSQSLCFFLFFYPGQIRKDAVSEVLVRQPWHAAIHSSLMWQGPSTAKPLLLLRRLLITVDKQAGGGPPTPTTPPSTPNET